MRSDLLSTLIGVTDQIPLSDWLREGWRPSAKPTDNVYFCSCSEDVLRQNHFFVSHDNAGNSFDTLPNILTRLLYKTRLMVLRDKLAFLRPALVHAWLIRRIIPGAPCFPIGSCLHQLWTRWQKPSASFFYFSLRGLAGLTASCQRRQQSLHVSVCDWSWASLNFVAACRLVVALQQPVACLGDPALKQAWQTTGHHGVVQDILSCVRFAHTLLLQALFPRLTIPFEKKLSIVITHRMYDV